uniref:Uncharacterized protein n=1 Tax=Haptolina brevifila TaxID=156173 RepID=A0A7S2BAW3_9EUKA
MYTLGVLHDAATAGISHVQTMRANARTKKKEKVYASARDKLKAASSKLRSAKKIVPIMAAPMPQKISREVLVLPKEKMSGASSSRANYKLQNKKIKAQLKYEGTVNAPVEHMERVFNDLLRVVKDGVGPRPDSGASLSLGIVRHGPGPLCCFDDQVVQHDLDKGSIDCEVVKVRCPLRICFAGSISHLTMEPGKERMGTTHIYFDSAHDFHPCCLCIPVLVYPCCNPAFPVLFRCLAFLHTGQCCCFCTRGCGCGCPSCIECVAMSWTSTCCPCCSICCG